MIYQIKSILSLLFFKTTEEYSELFIFIFLDFYRIGSALLPPPQYFLFFIFVIQKSSKSSKLCCKK